MGAHASEAEHRAFCELVAQLVIVDGAVTDAERVFLERVMDRFGLDAAAKKAVINSVDIDDPVGPRLALLSPETRRLLLSELEAAAALDGEIHPSERQMIEEVRRALA
jgi:uncharacterized tellurite resistance protein B-like protein